MADGRTRPLADVRPGDAIYGTVRQGSYRRYVPTRVRAWWQTVKPAYLTTLEDGTSLVTSGDHRFLTDRGWKYVTGAMGGPLQRPYLTTGNKLMGVGAFADQPKASGDYRHGYLCGMVRGDGSLGVYSYRSRRDTSVPARARRYRGARPGTGLSRQHGRRDGHVHLRRGQRNPAPDDGHPHRQPATRCGSSSG